MLVIYFKTFIYTDFTALIEALIKKYLSNAFFRGSTL